MNNLKSAAESLVWRLVGDKAVDVKTCSTKEIEMLQ